MNTRQKIVVPISVNTEKRPISCNSADDVNISAANAPMVVKQPMVNGMVNSLIISLGDTMLFK